MVYVIYDVSSTPTIVAITDNVYDAVYFVIEHHTKYAKEEAIDYYYNIICEQKMDIQDLGDYFKGVLVRQIRLNYDYIDNVPISSSL